MLTSNILSLTALVAVVSCGDPHEWRKPSPRDVRGPCPLLNSLANHGFLPRNGRNVSIDQLVNGIDEALNLEPASSRPVAELAVTTSTTGNPSTLNLNDLNKHGVIEHDGSLSRNDIFFGDNHSFNSTIWDSVVANFGGKEFITIATAAKARKARIAAAKAVNPTFNFTAREDQFSRFETALYLAVFGNGTMGNAKRHWVGVMFREERLPYREGFKRPTDVITNDDIVTLADKVAAAAQVPL